jgi:hypothetical protein
MPTSFAEPSLFYAPPYERPIEDELAWHLVKFLHPEAALDYQVRFETPAGPFYTDFVVEVPLGDSTRRVGFEITDALDPEHTVLRDALLVGGGHLDALLRLSPDDLLYRMHDVLLFALRLRPELFGTRGRVNLETLASTEALIADVRPGVAAEMAYVLPDPHAGLLFGGEELEPLPGAGRVLRVETYDQAHPQAWLASYFEALDFFGLTQQQDGASERKAA